MRHPVIIYPTCHVRLHCCVWNGFINPAISSFFSDSVCISGHHHHHEPQTSYCAPGQTRDAGSVMLNVGDIDYQMYHVLQSIPLAIQEAR